MADFNGFQWWGFSDLPNSDPPVRGAAEAIPAKAIFSAATDSERFLMLAQDAGRPSGSNYSTWLSEGAPDDAGAGYATSSPTPTGAMVAGSVRVLGRSTSR